MMKIQKIKRSLLFLSISLGMNLIGKMSAQGFESVTGLNNHYVVYGQDNRKDLFEISDPRIVKLAEASVALVWATDVQSLGGDLVKLNSSLLRVDQELCPGQKFENQPTVAFCSGSLVNENTIITAGHCISEKYCKDVKFVFGYGYYGGVKDPTILKTKDVYSCGQVIHTQNAEGISDFAVVKLDRNVLDRKFVQLRARGAIQKGDSVFVMGYPSGLPTKVAFGAKVRSEEKFLFKTHLDTFVNNSGSPVFNARTGIQEGILVTGEKDYVRDENQGCNVINVCKNNECMGEAVTKVKEVLPYIK